MVKVNKKLGIIGGILGALGIASVVGGTVASKYKKGVARNNNIIQAIEEDNEDIDVLSINKDTVELVAHPDVFDNEEINFSSVSALVDKIIAKLSYRDSVLTDLPNNWVIKVPETIDGRLGVMLYIVELNGYGNIDGIMGYFKPLHTDDELTFEGIIAVDDKDADEKGVYDIIDWDKLPDDFWEHALAKDED